MPPLLLALLLLGSCLGAIVLRPVLAPFSLENGKYPLGQTQVWAMDADAERGESLFIDYLAVNGGVQIVPVRQEFIIGKVAVKIAEFESCPQMNDEIQLQLFANGDSTACAMVSFSLDSLIPFNDRDEYERAINHLASQWSAREAYNIVQAWNSPKLIGNRPLSTIQRAGGNNPLQNTFEINVTNIDVHLVLSPGSVTQSGTVTVSAYTDSGSQEVTGFHLTNSASSYVQTVTLASAAIVSTATAQVTMIILNENLPSGSTVTIQAYNGVDALDFTSNTTLEDSTVTLSSDSNPAAQGGTIIVNGVSQGAGFSQQVTYLVLSDAVTSHTQTVDLTAPTVVITSSDLPIATIALDAAFGNGAEVVIQAYNGLDNPLYNPYSLYITPGNVVITAVPTIGTPGSDVIIYGEALTGTQQIEAIHLYDAVTSYTQTFTLVTPINVTTTPGIVATITIDSAFPNGTSLQVTAYNQDAPLDSSMVLPLANATVTLLASPTPALQGGSIVVEASVASGTQVVSTLVITEPVTEFAQTVWLNADVVVSTSAAALTTLTLNETFPSGSTITITPYNGSTVLADSYNLYLTDISVVVSLLPVPLTQGGQIIISVNTSSGTQEITGFEITEPLSGHTQVITLGSTFIASSVSAAAVTTTLDTEFPSGSFIVVQAFNGDTALSATESQQILDSSIIIAGSPAIGSQAGTVIFSATAVAGSQQITQLRISDPVSLHIQTVSLDQATMIVTSAEFIPVATVTLDSIFASGSNLEVTGYNRDNLLSYSLTYNLADAVITLSSDPAIADQSGVVVISGIANSGTQEISVLILSDSTTGHTQTATLSSVLILTSTPIILATITLDATFPSGSTVAITGYDDEEALSAVLFLPLTEAIVTLSAEPTVAFPGDVVIFSAVASVSGTSQEVSQLVLTDPVSLHAQTVVYSPPLVVPDTVTPVATVTLDTAFPAGASLVVQFYNGPDATLNSLTYNLNNGQVLLAISPSPASQGGSIVINGASTETYLFQQVSSFQISESVSGHVQTVALDPTVDFTQVSSPWATVTLDAEFAAGSTLSITAFNGAQSLSSSSSLIVSNGTVTLTSLPATVDQNGTVVISGVADSGLQQITALYLTETISGIQQTVTLASTIILDGVSQVIATVGLDVDFPGGSVVLVYARNASTNLNNALELPVNSDSVTLSAEPSPGTSGEVVIISGSAPDLQQVTSLVLTETVSGHYQTVTLASTVILNTVSTPFATVTIDVAFPQGSTLSISALIQDVVLSAPLSLPLTDGSVTLTINPTTPEQGALVTISGLSNGGISTQQYSSLLFYTGIASQAQTVTLADLPLSSTFIASVALDSTFASGNQVTVQLYNGGVALDDVLTFYVSDSTITLQAAPTVATPGDIFVLSGFAASGTSQEIESVVISVGASSSYQTVTLGSPVIIMDTLTEISTITLEATFPYGATATVIAYSDGNSLASSLLLPLTNANVSISTDPSSPTQGASVVFSGLFVEGDSQQVDSIILSDPVSSHTQTIAISPVAFLTSPAAAVATATLDSEFAAGSSLSMQFANSGALLEFPSTLNISNGSVNLSATPGTAQQGGQVVFSAAALSGTQELTLLIITSTTINHTQTASLDSAVVVVSTTVSPIATVTLDMDFSGGGTVTISAFNDANFVQYSFQMNIDDQSIQLYADPSPATPGASISISGNTVEGSQEIRTFVLEEPVSGVVQTVTLSSVEIITTTVSLIDNFLIDATFPYGGTITLTAYDGLNALASSLLIPLSNGVVTLEASPNPAEQGGQVIFSGVAASGTQVIDSLIIYDPVSTTYQTVTFSSMLLSNVSDVIETVILNSVFASGANLSVQAFNGTDGLNDILTLDIQASAITIVVTPEPAAQAGVVVLSAQANSGTQEISKFVLTEPVTGAVQTVTLASTVILSTTLVDLATATLNPNFPSGSLVTVQGFDGDGALSAAHYLPLSNQTVTLATEQSPASYNGTVIISASVASGTQVVDQLILSDSTTDSYQTVELGSSIVLTTSDTAIATFVLDASFVYGANVIVQGFNSGVALNNTLTIPIANTTITLSSSPSSSEQGGQIVLSGTSSGAGQEIDVLVIYDPTTNFYQTVTPVVPVVQLTETLLATVILDSTFPSGAVLTITAFALSGNAISQSLEVVLADSIVNMTAAPSDVAQGGQVIFSASCLSGTQIVNAIHITGSAAGHLQVYNIVGGIVVTTTSAPIATVNLDPDFPSGGNLTVQAYN